MLMFCLLVFCLHHFLFSFGNSKASFPTQFMGFWWGDSHCTRSRHIIPTGQMRISMSPLPHCFRDGPHGAWGSFAEVCVHSGGVVQWVGCQPRSCPVATWSLCPREMESCLCCVALSVALLCRRMAGIALPF